MNEANQLLLNVVFGVAGTLSIFVLTAVWSRLGKLEKSDADLAAEISQMHILVAGEYIKRNEISPQLNKIYDELKGIRAELSTKAERGVRHNEGSAGD